MSLIFAFGIFNGILPQRKQIFTHELTFIVVLVNGVNCFNSLFSISSVRTSWPSSQPGLLHSVTAILSAAACSHFPLYPGRKDLHVAPNAVLPVFSLSNSSLFPAKDHRVQPPFSSPLPGLCLGSSSDCPKPAGKDKAPYDSFMGQQGEVGAGEDRALQGSCVWAGYNLALSVRLLAARGRQHCYLGRAHRWAVSTGGCLHAPAGPGEPKLPAPGEQPSQKSNSLTFP